MKIEDRLTIIVGKNEQGKTNFLRALASFNPEVNYRPSDLPNHLLPTLEAEDHNRIPIITLWLTPDTSERRNLKEVVANIDTVEEFGVTRFFSGKYEYWSIDKEGQKQTLAIAPPDISALVIEMTTEAEALRVKLTGHGNRFPTFAASLGQANGHIDQFVKADFTDHSQLNNIVKTFATALKGIPNQDQAIQEDIASTTEKILAKQNEIQRTLSQKSMVVFEKRIPRFIFHSASLDHIPNDVNVADYIADPEKVSRGMANLCGAAGLSTQKIRELASTLETAKRETYEDHYRASISGGINEFWTQEEYTVYFRIEKERLSVSISDSTYTPRVPPSDRSDGFQWYLSFYCTLLNEVSGSESNIVLLDNPGLELHSDGQRDVKRFLEEKMPPTTQIIYVTHSPAMVDPYNLEQLRKAELKGEMKGTRIEELRFDSQNDLDLLEPLRSAIGTSLVSSLVFNEFNVLVEGAADKLILEGAFGALEKEKSKKILVNAPMSERASFLPHFYFRTGLPFVVLLDADSRGRELATALRRWDIPDETIIDLAKITSKDGQRREPKGDFELEDLMSEDFYHQAVNETYPSQPVELKKIEEQGQGKRTRKYEDAYKQVYSIGFNNRRVAETVKQRLLREKGDKETLDNLRKVVSAIIKALEGQVGNESTKGT